MLRRSIWWCVTYTETHIRLHLCHRHSLDLVVISFVHVLETVNLASKLHNLLLYSQQLLSCLTTLCCYGTRFITATTKDKIFDLVLSQFISQSYFFNIISNVISVIRTGTKPGVDCRSTEMHTLGTPCPHAQIRYIPVSRTIEDCIAFQINKGLRL